MPATRQHQAAPRIDVLLFTLRLLVALVASMGFAPRARAQCLGSQTCFDTDFATAVTPGAVTGGPGGTANFTPITSNSPPGRTDSVYGQFTITVSGTNGYACVYAPVLLGCTPYNPATQGEIHHIDYSEFLRGRSNGSGTSTFWTTCCIRQGGVIYIAALRGATVVGLNTWRPVSIPNLVATDFVPITSVAAICAAPTVASHPDFSCNGLPIEVGLARGNSGAIQYSTTADVDDVSINIVNPAAPANDTCTSCTPLPVPYGSTSSTTIAWGCSTLDGSSACDGAGVNQDVWYCVTVCNDTRITLDTCGTPPQTDSVLSVHTACPGTTANEIVCSDNNLSCGVGSLQAKVVFFAQANRTYYVRVARRGAPCGTGVLTISATNQAGACCADAIPISAGESVDGTTIGATACMTPRGCGGIPPFAPTPNVWYDFVPACTGTYVIDLWTAPQCLALGPSWHAELSVFARCGDPSALPVPCQSNVYSNPYNNGIRPRIVLPAQACTHYYIRVGGHTLNDAGNYRITISPETCSGPPPSNDFCPAAIRVPVTSGGGFSVPFNTCCAITDGPPTEPIYNDVWFWYLTGNCGGPVTVDTCGTPLNFDTAIAVYGGPPFLCPPTPNFRVAFSDNAAISGCIGTLLSSVQFTATPNTYYLIRVGSAVPGKSVCGRLNVVGPNPQCQRCPPVCNVFCASKPWQPRLFQVSGYANNMPWSWCISQPCCFDFASPNVLGVVPSPLPPLPALIADQFALASRFCTSITQAGCTSRAVLANTVGTSGVFQVKVRACSPTVPPRPNWVLRVGPPDAQNSSHCEFCSLNCVVADIAGNDPITTSGPCRFNPEITDLPISQQDCNNNGEDDTIDILQGWSADTNNNGVPDECENPCAAVLNDSFEAYRSEAATTEVCGFNGWEEWIGSEDVCGAATNERAFSGTQSLKIVGSVGGSTGHGDDTVRRFFGVTSGRWIFRTMTFVPTNATGVGYLNLLSTYDDPPGSPVADFRWAVQVHFDADASMVLADLNAGATALVKGRWAEFRIEIDLDQDLASYFYDGAAFVQGRSWSCGLGTPFCGTERRLQAVDLYGGEPGQGGTSGMYFDDVSLRPACPPTCVADVDDGTGTGTPDGGVTIDDLLYYLFIFEAGDPGSDVDDGSGTGTPDGGVTIDDLLYYLVRFESGC